MNDFSCRLMLKIKCKLFAQWRQNKTRENVNENKCNKKVRFKQHNGIRIRCWILVVRKSIYFDCVCFLFCSFEVDPYQIAGSSSSFVCDSHSIALSQENFLFCVTIQTLFGSQGLFFGLVEQQLDLWYDIIVIKKIEKRIETKKNRIKLVFNMQFN